MEEKNKNKNKNKSWNKFDCFFFWRILLTFSLSKFRGVKKIFSGWKMIECLEGMDGWMNGWMDEWMNGWMDEWIDGWMDEWIDRWMDEWMNG